MTTYQIKEGWQQMDLEAVYQFLSEESYWAKNIPVQTVIRALEHSYCVGVFDADRQIGFARLVTDYATFAYLADVYILKEYRGNGLSKMLMKYLTEKEWVKGLRRILLATSDAHGLYKQFGFDAPAKPESLMEINRKNIYELLT